MDVHNSPNHIEEPPVTQETAEAHVAQPDYVAQAEAPGQEPIVEDVKPAVDVPAVDPSTFGNAGTRTVPMIGQAYRVDPRPIAEDTSPFKELMPPIEEIVPMSAKVATEDYENSTVYNFVVPNVSIVKGSDPSTAIGDFSTQQTMPRINVLHSNMAGLPTEPPEVPLIMSLPPPYTSSFLHDVQQKFSNGCLDLRYVITGADRTNIKEIYYLGRIWTPLEHFTILWNYAAGNWDAVEPRISPAFSELLSLRMNSPKDIASLTTAFRFSDNMSVDISARVLGALRRVAGIKLGLSRLYWRLWALYIEAAAKEEQQSELIINEVLHQEPASDVQTSTQLDLIMKMLDSGVQPFFLCEAMMQEVPNIDILNILYVALATKFTTSHQYGILENLPPLGHIKYIVPKGMHHMLRSEVVLRSNDIFQVLLLFGKLTGQFQLIEEIGRTVSTFLVRPEGDAAWLGHNVIQMELPYFKCVKTLMFSWKLDMENMTYDMKPRPLYKLSWIGAIRYMMASLAANTALSEMGYFTVLQLEKNGMEVPISWYNRAVQYLSNGQNGVPLNQFILRIGLRVGWGTILNRILASMVIISPKMERFTRIVQWSEWLVMNRQAIEGTFAASMLSHMQTEKSPELGVYYTPKMLGAAADDSDVFYRLAVTDVAQINLHLNNPRMIPVCKTEVKFLAGSSGLPLDGQFRKIMFGRYLNNWFSFACDSRKGVHKIAFEWYDRRNWTWTISSIKVFGELAEVGEADGLELKTGTFMPGRDDVGEEQLHRVPVLDFDALRMVDEADDDVITFGNPSDISESMRYSSGSDLEGQQVRRYALSKQEYPIHYCRQDRNPTVGELIFKYGLQDRSGVCGTRVIHVVAARKDAQKFKVPKLIEYVVPLQHSLRKRKLRRKLKDDALHFHKEHQPPKTQLRDPRLVDIVRPDARTPLLHSVEEEEQRFKRMEDVRRETAAPLPPDDDYYVPQVKQTINALKGYMTLNGVTDTSADFLLAMFESLLGLNRHAVGASIALNNRMTSLLHTIDEMDLHAQVRMQPMSVRGEYCRSMEQLLSNVANAVPSGLTMETIYKKASKWFHEATRALSLCPAMTIDEYKELGIVVDQAFVDAIGTKNMEPDIQRALQRSHILAAPKQEHVEELKQQVQEAVKEVVNDVGTTVENFQKDGGHSPAASNPPSGLGLHMESGPDEVETPDVAKESGAPIAQDAKSSRKTSSIGSVKSTPRSVTAKSDSSRKPVTKNVQIMGMKKK